MHAESSASIKTPLRNGVGGFANNNYWSSSENNANNAWNQNFNNGNQNNNNKNNTFYVRAVRVFEQAGYEPGHEVARARGFLSMQLELFPAAVEPADSSIPLEELFTAYFSCRRHKRTTINALAFELDYESNLVQLCNEINSGSYKHGKSIAFIVEKPVKREIFAADFRDRVVHHLIISKLNPLFEKKFIYDSYACRVGKGTHFGIQRVNRFIRQCSRNYTQDCYILKLDVKGFFMHIDRNILFGKLWALIKSAYVKPDRNLIIDLCREIIYNDPVRNCVINGHRSDWHGLPPDKSLFYSSPECGLPIGNLTSQVFANFYMDSFDHFVKHDLGIRFYGRYVDDFVMVHSDKEYLRALIPKIKNFLASRLRLSLHPDKIYLQHYTKGVKYLGVVIKPRRIYMARRTKGNFYAAIERQNLITQDHRPDKQEKGKFLSSMNSYLGSMKHYKTFSLRKKIISRNLSEWWWRYVYLSYGIGKFVLVKPGTPHRGQAVNQFFSP